MFAVDPALDPTGVLAVVATGASHRIWNTQHDDFVCWHHPSPDETLDWLSDGADADTPPCPHCARYAAPTFPPMSVRVRALRIALWRVPRTAAALDAALVQVKRGSDEEGQPEKPQKRVRGGGDSETAQALQHAVQLPNEMMVEILSWLDPAEMGPALLVNEQLRAVVRDRLQRLPTVHVVGLMLSTADSGNAPLLAALLTHRNADLFAPAALRAAAESGARGTVAMLLDDGRSDPDGPNLVRDADYTPLKMAAWLGHAEVVRQLLKEQRQRHPLVYMASMLKAVMQSGRVHVWRVLREAGLPERDRRGLGFADMMVIAARFAQATMVEELVAKPFDTDEQWDLDRIHDPIEDEDEEPLQIVTAAALRATLRLEDLEDAVEPLRSMRWLKLAIEKSEPMHVMLMLRDGRIGQQMGSFVQTITENDRPQGVPMLALLLAAGRVSVGVRELRFLARHHAAAGMLRVLVDAPGALSRADVEEVLSLTGIQTYPDSLAAILREWLREQA